MEKDENRNCILVIFDQHAVAERIRFEYMEKFVKWNLQQRIIRKRKNYISQEPKVPLTMELGQIIAQKQFFNNASRISVIRMKDNLTIDICILNEETILNASTSELLWIEQNGEFLKIWGYEHEIKKGMNRNQDKILNGSGDDWLWGSDIPWRDSSDYIILRSVPIILGVKLSISSFIEFVQYIMRNGGIEQIENNTSIYYDIKNEDKVLLQDQQETLMINEDEIIVADDFDESQEDKSNNVQSYQTTIKKQKDITVDNKSKILPIHQSMLLIPPAIQRVIASRACRGAVLFGDPLTETQGEALLCDLNSCKHPLQCAHGRISGAPIADISQIKQRSNERRSYSKPENNININKIWNKGSRMLARLKQLIQSSIVEEDFLSQTEQRISYELDDNNFQI